MFENDVCFTQFEENWLCGPVTAVRQRPETTINWFGANCWFIWKKVERRSDADFSKYELKAFR